MGFINEIDWKFWLGDVLIPIGTFVIGLFVGGSVERKKAKSKVKGSGNIVIQNSDIHK